MVGRPAILFRTHLENIRPGAGHPTGQPATTGRFRPLRTGRPGETRRTLRRRAAPRRTGHLPRCHLRFPPPRPRHRPVTCREYTATSCRTANDRHRKTAIVPIRQEHKHFQTEKKIIFRALSFQRTRRLTVDDSGTTSYPQPSAQFRPTGAHRHPPRHTRFIAEIRSACRLFIRQCRHHQHRQNTLPHGLPLSPFTDKKNERNTYGFLSLSSGGRTRTSDLWVMSPTSCQLLHPAIYRTASTALNRLFGNPRTLFPAAFLF